MCHAAMFMVVAGSSEAEATPEGEERAGVEADVVEAGAVEAAVVELAVEEGLRVSTRRTSSSVRSRFRS